MATSVIISSVDAAQKKYQKSITDVSPSVADSDLAAFAQAVNGLTDDTVTAIRRVETTDLLNDTRLPRNMALDTATLAASKISTDPSDPKIINLTGIVDAEQLQVTRKSDPDHYLYIDWGNYDDSGELEITISLVTDSTGAGATTVTFTMPADDTYQAESVTLTVTE